jgi:hypothetical protein
VAAALQRLVLLQAGAKHETEAAGIAQREPDIADALLTQPREWIVAATGVAGLHGCRQVIEGAGRDGCEQPGGIAEMVCRRRRRDTRATRHLP